MVGAIDWCRWPPATAWTSPPYLLRASVPSRRAHPGQRVRLGLGTAISTSLGMASAALSGALSSRVSPFQISWVPVVVTTSCVENKSTLLLSLVVPTVVA
jgi:hypothetical protein